MYRQLPTAIIAAREEEALTHGQVLYGLIKPTKDMDQVESTAAMVNVIPRKRIYRMDKKEDMDLFLTELMKRPLVLQPSAYIGRGLAIISCSMFTKEEHWIIIINQSHPKIRSRIQMGIDAARVKMDKGEPFILQLSFNKYLKRVYLESLTNTALDPRFTFIDFEDAEIVIRYPGDRYHRGIKWELQTKINFEFDDLLPSEVTRRTVSAAQIEWKDPALRVVMPDELSQLLSGWEFEQEDPLASVIPPEYDDEGAVGGIDMSQETEPMMPNSGKIVGRAKRKANNSNGAKYQVPVELHVPEAGGRQILHQGHIPPSSPDRRGEVTSSRPYEDLDRHTYTNEHTYEHSRVHKSNVPRSVQVPHGMDSPYEEMNVTNRQYNSPYSQGASSPHTPGTQHTPTYPYMENTPRTALSPRTPTSPPAQSEPRTPTAPRYNDRYNTEPETRSSQKTYLTDDDDGGFSLPSPRSRQQSDNKYDTNFNRNAEVDRYGNPVSDNKGQYSPVDRYGNPVSDNKGQYSPVDRYGNPVSDNKGQYSPVDRYGNPQPASNFTKVPPSSTQRPNPNMGNVTQRPTPSPRGKFPPVSKPASSPMGFHHNQGSGRSDSSTSDSGFGDNENGRESHTHRTEKPKTPYYNSAYEQDSPDKDRVIVDDIMAKHKALAAKMLHQQGEGVQNTSPNSMPHTQDFYNGQNYGKEVQKWRRNINNLEDACDVPEVDFSRSRLHVNSEVHQGQDQMEESFI